MSALPRQAPHNGTSVGGRPIRVPVGKATVRQLIKRHLKEDGRRMQDLGEPWQCKGKTVYDMFCDGRPFSPAHLRAAADFLQLDEFDRAELMLLGARESGFEIDPKYLLEAA